MMNKYKIAILLLSILLVLSALMVDNRRYLYSDFHGFQRRRTAAST